MIGPAIRLKTAKNRKIFSAIQRSFHNIAAMTSGTKRLLIGAAALLILTNLLGNPFPFGRSMAATALGKFGEKAKSAAPLLESKLNEVQTSGAAREALKAIDPDWKPK